MSRVCLGGAVVAGCAMPRTQLPIFPASSCAITPEHAFEQRDGSGVYFNGHLPVFAHPAADLAAFRLFSSQLIANGAATQVQITRAFAVPLVTVKRACKKLRQEGAAGCFRPPVPRQGHRLTAAVLAEAQALLDAGLAPAAVAARLGVLPNTLNKSMHAGRLKKRSRRRGSRSRERPARVVGGRRRRRRRCRCPGPGRHTVHAECAERGHHPLAGTRGGGAGRAGGSAPACSATCPASRVKPSWRPIRCATASSSSSISKDTRPTSSSGPKTSALPSSAITNTPAPTGPPTSSVPPSSPCKRRD